MKSGESFWYYILAFIIWTIILAIAIAVFTKLWNVLIPQLFNGPIITFWQMLGLWALAKLLFGNIINIDKK